MNTTTQTQDALYLVGHRLIGLQRYRDALSVFRTMLLVNPRDERGWLALATCHQELDEPEKAITICHLAEVACENKAVRCTIARARIHRSLGSFEEAAEAYAQASRVADALDDRDAAIVIASEGGA
jgi:tetratricopeptide (TPR) repeat protein